MNHLPFKSISNTKWTCFHPEYTFAGIVETYFFTIILFRKKPASVLFPLTHSDQYILLVDVWDFCNALLFVFSYLTLRILLKTKLRFNLYNPSEWKQRSEDLVIQIQAAQV